MNQDSITVSGEGVGKNKGLAVFDVADVTQNGRVQDFIHLVAVFNRALLQAVDSCSVSLTGFWKNHGLSL